MNKNYDIMFKNGKCITITIENTMNFMQKVNDILTTIRNSRGTKKDPLHYSVPVAFGGEGMLSSSFILDLNDISYVIPTANVTDSK